jgi:hypothetical protein
MPAPDSPVRHGAIQTMSWWLAMLLLYAALGADVFYKTDGPDLLRLLANGERHPWHVGYLPALSGFRSALAAFGLDPAPIVVGNLFSAFGMATGVAFFHSGLRRLGLVWSAREAATALLALSPTALLFASVVEFHAPLMAAVGLAFWWTTVQVRHPSWWGMALLGVMTHVTFLLHSSSIVLPAWLLCFFLAHHWQVGERARALRLATVSGAVHSLLFLLLPRLFPVFYGWHSDWAKAREMEASIGRPQTIDFSGEIIVQEWLVPLMPIAVACLLAVRHRALRLQFTAFVIAWVPYVYICVRQLVYEPEFGAYMLPLVPAAALLTAQAAPRRALPGLILASVVVAGIVRHEALPPALRRSYDQFVERVEQAAAGEDYLLLVCRYDEEAICAARLSSDLTSPDGYYSIRSQALYPRAGYDEATRAATLAPLQGIAEQKKLLISEGAREWLEDPARMRLSEKSALPPMGNEEFAGPVLLEDLRAVFVFEPVAGADATPGNLPGAARIYRLRPR